MLKKSILKAVDSGVYLYNKLLYWKNGQIVTFQDMTKTFQELQQSTSAISNNGIVGRGDYATYSCIVSVPLGLDGFEIHDNGTNFVFNLSERDEIQDIAQLVCQFNTDISAITGQANIGGIQAIMLRNVNPNNIQDPNFSTGINLIDGTYYIFAKLNITPSQTNQSMYSTYLTFVTSAANPDVKTHCLICKVTINYANKTRDRDFTGTNFLSNVGISHDRTGDRFEDRLLDNTQHTKGDNYYSITPANLAYYSNMGVISEYQNSIYYAKGRQIRTYEESYGYIYWLSTSNTGFGGGIPTVAAPKSWRLLYIITNDGEVVYPHKIKGNSLSVINEITAKSVKAFDSITTTISIADSFQDNSTTINMLKNLSIGKVITLPNYFDFKLRYQGQNSVTIYGSISDIEQGGLPANPLPYDLQLSNCKVDVSKDYSIVSSSSIKNTAAENIDNFSLYVSNDAGFSRIYVWPVAYNPHQYGVNCKFILECELVQN